MTGNSIGLQEALSELDNIYLTEEVNDSSINNNVKNFNINKLDSKLLSNFKALLDYPDDLKIELRYLTNNQSYELQNYFKSQEELLADSSENQAGSYYIVIKLNSTDYPKFKFISKVYYNKIWIIKVSDKDSYSEDLAIKKLTDELTEAIKYCSGYSKYNLLFYIPKDVSQIYLQSGNKYYMLVNIIPVTNSALERGPKLTDILTGEKIYGIPKDAVVVALGKGKSRQVPYSGTYRTSIIQFYSGLPENIKKAIGISEDANITKISSPVKNSPIDTEATIETFDEYSD